MKVVLPVHHFPPRSSAGAELYTLRLARWLMARGDEAEVVCIETVRWDTSNRVTARHDVYEGISVWRLALEASPEGWQFRNYDSPELEVWFAQYLAETRPDVAHFQAGYLIGAGPLRAAAAAGVPTVLTLHDFWFLCPRITLLRGDGTLCPGPPADAGACAWCMQLEGRAARLAERLSAGAAGRLVQAAGLSGGRRIDRRREVLLDALTLPDAVIAPSHFLADRFHPHVPPGRLHIRRYGLASSRLRTMAALPAPTDETLQLAYLGQIAPHKGVHILIEALRLVPATGRRLKLTIHGDLDQHREYGRKIRELAAGDSRIVLAGPFENDRIEEVLAACHATVAPSIWYENSPLAIMEAQAAHRPVLTSGLGGMAELVRHEVDGLHFLPGDATDLARQIERLRSEPGLLERLRQGVRAPASIDDEMVFVTEVYAKIQPRQDRRAYSEKLPS